MPVPVSLSHPKPWRAGGPELPAEMFTLAVVVALAMVSVWIEREEQPMLSWPLKPLRLEEGCRLRDSRSRCSPRRSGSTVPAPESEPVLKEG